MKNDSISPDIDGVNYIADVIHENLHTSKDPVGYGYWTLAFHDTFEDFKSKEDTDGKIATFYNFLMISKDKNHRWIFKNMCNYIYYFEREGLIKNADEFIGSMIAWVLDPIRSYSTKEERKKAIEEINFVLNRKGWSIKNRDAFKKYVFEQQTNITPVGKDALYFYGDRLFITEGRLCFKKPNEMLETIKTKPADCKILEYFIGIGKGNIENWLKKAQIAESLDLNVRTVSNSISAIRKISTTVGISLIEDKGADVKGKEFRINPKVL
jgi:hypothetical protein